MIKFKAALVTGADRPVGLTIAIDLARRGLDVALHYSRGQDEAAATVAEILSMGRRSVALDADLTREADVSTLIARAADALGPVDVLINSASLSKPDDWNSATRESWDLHMEANLRAPFVLMQEFARGLPAGCMGTVVNVVDERVWSLPPHHFSYTLSKTGLWTLTRTMAQALAPQIRVNGIGPGPEQSDTRNDVAGDICAAIGFLLEADAMTGQMVALGGGEGLDWAEPANGFTPEK